MVRTNRSKSVAPTETKEMPDRLRRSCSRALDPNFKYRHFKKYKQRRSKDERKERETEDGELMARRAQVLRAAERNEENEKKEKQKESNKEKDLIKRKRKHKKQKELKRNKKVHQSEDYGVPQHPEVLDLEVLVPKGPLPRMVFVELEEPVEEDEIQSPASKPKIKKKKKFMKKKLAGNGIAATEPVRIFKKKIFKKKKEESRQKIRSEKIMPEDSERTERNNEQKRTHWKNILVEYVEKTLEKIRKQEKLRVARFMEKIFETADESSVETNNQDSDEDENHEEFKTITNNIATYSKELWLLLNKIMPDGEHFLFPPKVRRLLISVPSEELHKYFFDLTGNLYENRLPSSGMKDLYSNLQRQMNSDQNQLEDVLYCKRCVCYNCGLHDKSTLEKPRFGLMVRDDSGDWCGTKCYKQYGEWNEDVFSPPTIAELFMIKNKSFNDVTGYEHLTFFCQQLAVEGFDICEITRRLQGLGRKMTCAEVFKLSLGREQYIKDNIAPLIINDVDETGSEAKARRQRQLNYLVEHNMLTNVEKMESCNHEGPCEKAGLDCSCFVKNHPCTRFCGCSLKCIMQFPGCQCHKEGATRCRNDSCICIKYNWECDAEVCGCVPGAKDEECRSKINGRIDLKLKKEKLSQCQNTVVQRKVLCKMEVGKSNNLAAGRGCFIQIDVKKNRFLGEFCGEVISFDEHLHRDALYNKLSYSFEINNSQLIDGTYFGNVLRFTNNVEKGEKPNCKVKIFVVHGEHKVKFYAAKKMSAGTELRMDYKYDKEAKQIHFGEKC